MNRKYTAIFLSAVFLLSFVFFHSEKSVQAVISQDSLEKNKYPTKVASIPYDAVFPEHEPYGTGVGVKPGRVVWTYTPNSVEWDGEGYWWKAEHFDEAAIQKMVNDGIASLAGESNVQSGWSALFRGHNESYGKQEGYKSGQKIAIKTNMNGAGAYSDDVNGETVKVIPILYY